MDSATAAIIGAAVGAAGTAVVTGLSLWAAHRHSREERHQDRIERTYLHVLEVLNAGWKVVETDSTDNREPDYDEIDSRIDAIWAEMDAFGSDAVRTLMNSWRAAWLEFKIDMHNARLPGASSDRYSRGILRDNRKRAVEAAQEIRLQIGAELRGQKKPRTRK